MKLATSRITIRGFFTERGFDENAGQTIEVPGNAHMNVSEHGTVHIGYDAAPGEVEGTYTYSRQVTYPAWRVLEVETISGV